jgi:hypothetical protein
MVAEKIEVQSAHGKPCISETEFISANLSFSTLSS